MLDLDSEGCLDPGRVGSKATWLARGRRIGLPVLPGFVVEAEASRNHMDLGAETLTSRGSGGARLAIAGEPIPFVDELISTGAHLGTSLVARSSTALESSGAWSGAFTSYLDLSPPDLPKAVTGCWASAFSVAALARQRAASIEPGSFPMPVLIQAALWPEAGGAAEIETDGTVVVHGIKGSPAPLLQGWSTGATAQWNGRWEGPDLIQLLGVPKLDTIAAILRDSRQHLGTNRCEWAVDDDGIHILQLDATVMAPHGGPEFRITEDADPALIHVARAVMRAPGPLGEELILPWALAGLSSPSSAASEPPAVALDRAMSLCSELTSEVWRLPAAEALRLARECMAQLRGTDPSAALDRIRLLRPPDPKRSAVLVSLVAGLRGTMVDLGAALDPTAAWRLSIQDIDLAIRGTPRGSDFRIGVGQWEPLVASVVLSSGSSYVGTSASPGVGAGIRSRMDDFQSLDSFSSRGVVTSTQPAPNLSPLLWNAAGLVTETGSPAAHLFESARSLGVPAVCGVSLTGNSEQIVAVDGHTGLVATLSLYGDHGV